MAIEWFKNNKKDEKAAGEDDVEIKPAEFKAHMDKVAGWDSTVTEIKSKFAVLDEMSEFLKEQKEARQRKQQEEQQTQRVQADQDLDSEWLTDPKAAAQKTMAPLVTATVNTNARLTINEMMANHDEFEFGQDPVMRRELETLVSQLPLQARTDPASIRNCYYVAEGKHRQEIKEGKIRSSLASAISSGNGTGGSQGTKDEVVTLTPLQKKAAAMFGMDEKEYAKGFKDLAAPGV